MPIPDLSSQTFDGESTAVGTPHLIDSGSSSCVTRTNLDIESGNVAFIAEQSDQPFSRFQISIQTLNSKRFVDSMREDLSSLQSITPSKAKCLYYSPDMQTQGCTLDVLVRP